MFKEILFSAKYNQLKVATNGIEFEIKKEDDKYYLLDKYYKDSVCFLTLPEINENLFVIFDMLYKFVSDKFNAKQIIDLHYDVEPLTELMKVIKEIPILVNIRYKDLNKEFNYLRFYFLSNYNHYICYQYKVSVAVNVTTGKHYTSYKIDKLNCGFERFKTSHNIWMPAEDVTIIKIDNNFNLLTSIYDEFHKIFSGSENNALYKELYNQIELELLSII